MLRAHKHDGFFTPPKFISMSAVGVDISDRNIKFTELFPEKKGYSLGCFGNVPIPQGVVEGGKIVNSIKLVEILNKLRVDKKLSFVRSALQEEQVYFFRARYPDGTKEVLRDTIELSLEDHVPIPAADAVFDFEVVGHFGSNVDVAVTVATKATVQSYMDVFRDAGLTLLSLELEASAISRSVVDTEDTNAHMIIDFGEASTGVTIVYGRQVYVTSTMNVGGQMLTETVSKHMGISIAEAENLKRTVGLQRNSDNEELFAILLTNIAILRDEINKHLIYWHTHVDEDGRAHPEIKKLLLVGGDSNLPGLPEYLAATLRIEAVVGDVWTNVTLPSIGVPELTKEESLSYGTAIGLALHIINYE
jgi:type IV pilus assembly protein PilM